MNTKEKEMSNLEKLYYNLPILKDDYMENEEVTEARHDVETALGEKTYIKCEIKISMLEGVAEKHGFINGFQYAVSLLTSGKAVSV